MYVIFVGCSEPELENDGILRLYSMRFYPFATRVHIVLDAKGIPYHTININTSHKPGWFFKINPIGKIPALLLVNEPGQPIITESHLIAEYLDDVYPEIKLFDSNPLKRVLDKMWIERFTTVTAAFGRIYRNIEEAPEAWEEAMRALDLFEMELKKRGDVYFGGTERPNILDYSIWPWFQYFEIAYMVFGEETRYDTSRFPRLVNSTYLLTILCYHLRTTYSKQ